MAMQFSQVDRNHEGVKRLGYGRHLLEIYTNRPMGEMGRRVAVGVTAEMGGQKRIQAWIDETGNDDPRAMEKFAIM